MIGTKGPITGPWKHLQTIIPTVCPLNLGEMQSLIHFSFCMCNTQTIQGLLPHSTLPSSLQITHFRSSSIQYLYFCAHSNRATACSYFKVWRWAACHFWILTSTRVRWRVCIEICGTILLWISPNGKVWLLLTALTMCLLSRESRAFGLPDQGRFS